MPKELKKTKIVLKTAALKRGKPEAYRQKRLSRIP